tara:strand:+ start:266 stop:511 length:246 start_codon:yes stop_codon:yes gene_type:complete
MICKTCKTEINWRMHECKKKIGEYLGCEKCDNWCTDCRPNWNDELNNNKLFKSEEDKKSKKRSKNVQNKQQRNNSRTKKKV